MPLTHDFKNSKMLQGCEYDPENKMLKVTFANGNRYKYHGFTQDDYNAFTKAESAGSHFSNFVRGKFEHYKLEEDQ